MAVYTEVSAEDLEAFLADYALGRLISFKGIAEGIENSNYLVMTGSGPHVLTLYERRVDESELPFFIGLMEHLAARGVPCPTPLRDRRGSALKRLNGRPAALVSFLAGVSASQVDSRHCRAVGRALAELHVAGADFEIRRENDLSLAGWDRLARACGARADALGPGLAAEIRAELELLGARWPAALPAGVVHADLFRDNVFFEGGRLSGLIDFYFACNDLFAYDVAIALNAWCFEPDHAWNEDKARNLLGGYGEVRPLEPDEVRALPLLARGASLRFLLTRLYDRLHPVPGALVTPKDPEEYVAKLRFHRGGGAAAAYGLAEPA